ncbi:hypothetical protein JXA80_04320 [bacterium]|nr:hypothetical protein [candidate division CSSED10-310 bacterium]
MYLQHLLDEIQAHQRRCREIPELIASLTEKLTGARTKVDAIKVSITENEGKIRKSERLITDSRDMQGKYRTQLFKLKSNREYQALNKEIEVLSERISDAETEIILSMEEIDRARDQLTEAEGYLNSEKERIGQEQKVLEAELHEERRRLSEAEIAYRERYGKLGDDIRDNYDRLIRKNGRAVAELNQKSCGNCFVKVRPQIAATAADNNTLVLCDKCGVYLYSHIPSQTGD